MTDEDEIAEKRYYEKLYQRMSWYWPRTSLILANFDYDDIRPIVNRRLRSLNSLLEWLNLQLYYSNDLDIGLTLLQVEKEIKWFTRLKESKKYKDMNLEQIRSIPITSVYEFKKKGRMVSCPFHEDKTPSGMINTNGTYKCFSCGFYGDVIEFVKKLNNIDFRGAVDYLRISHRN